VLSLIETQFPTARTSMSCIAYYRNALKKGPAVKGGVSGDPAALRAKAAQLLAQADEVEKQMEAQKAADAQNLEEATTPDTTPASTEQPA